MITRRQVLQALIGTGFATAMPMRKSLAAASPRVVAIDWAATEALLALGIAPIAVSDTDYYRTRMKQPELPRNVVDIGPFWEINLEFVESLKPDFILATEANLLMIPRLRDVGRVEIVESTMPFSGRYGLAENILRQVGRLSELPANRAGSLIAAAEKHLEQLRLRLSAAPQLPVLIILPDQSGRLTGIYGEGSLPAAVLSKLGLRCAWTGPVNSLGMARTGFDSFLSMEDAAILVIDIPTQRLQTEQALAASKLWQALPAVKNAQVARIEQFYPYGGVPSALILADTLVASLEEFNR